jgi:hypothetical protein
LSSTSFARWRNGVDIGSARAASLGADGSGLLGGSGAKGHSTEDDVGEFESGGVVWIPLANGEPTSVNRFCGYGLLSMSARRRSNTASVTAIAALFVVAKYEMKCVLFVHVTPRSQRKSPCLNYHLQHCRRLLDLSPGFSWRNEIRQTANERVSCTGIQ